MNHVEDLARQQHQAWLEEAEAWRLQHRAQLLARAERRVSRAERQLAERRCQAERLYAEYGPQVGLAR